ncbi:hypothetical protein D0T87_10565 [Bacteroides sp. 51]|nr:hypothetical protein [Bacteroides sp. 51]
MFFVRFQSIFNFSIKKTVQRYGILKYLSYICGINQMNCTLFKPNRKNLFIGFEELKNQKYHGVSAKKNE